MKKADNRVIAYVVRRDDGVFWDARNDKWDLYWDAPLEDEVFDEPVLPGRIARENGGHVIALGELPEPVEVTEEEAEFISKARHNVFFRPSASICEYAANKDLGNDDENRLIRAYVNGYKVVRPKQYNVLVPHTKDTYYWKAQDGITAGGIRHGNTSQFKFTLNEIKENGLQGYEREEVPEDDAD